MEDAILFNHSTHKRFFYRMLGRCSRKRDVYCRSLFYILGISRDTRNHVDEIFDFESESIKPEALYAAWQTGSSSRLTRLAFNLWNGWTEEGRERMKYLTAAYPRTS